MAMESTFEGEEELLDFSSLLGAATYSQLPQGVGSVGEGRRRRRRKKVKEDVGEGKKRRLTDKQVQFLEMSFAKERKLESGRKEHLAAELDLDPKQVAVWFQNRRARWKNKQLEGEFTMLKSAHDAAVVDKFHLENEVLRLKERLSEAEDEVRKLTVGLTGGEKSGSSPSSFVSTGNDQCQTYPGQLNWYGRRIIPDVHTRVQLHDGLGKFVRNVISNRLIVVRGCQNRIYEKRLRHGHGHG